MRTVFIFGQHITSNPHYVGTMLMPIITCRTKHWSDLKELFLIFKDKLHVLQRSLFNTLFYILL